jgi:hypothetical protein
LRFAGDEAAARAEILGLALRAGLGLAGPAPAVIGETSLKLSANTLTLLLPGAREGLIAESVTKRFEALAKALDRSLRVELK